MLRYWTAGESHGKTMLAIVDGFPAGVEIETDSIDAELKRRQGGYGRGGRQQIEKDALEGTIIQMPVREDITLPIDEQLIVELYSR